MAKIISLLILLAVLSALFFCLKAPRAEQVEHHGSMVSAEAHALECLACHDGITAKSVTNCVGINCLLSIKSHPVEKPYPQEGAFVKYVDVLRSGIRLDNGMVSCVSCHDLKNQGPGHPPVKDKSGSLCFGCHLK